ncbi:hypothetical protein DL762_007288 [Monosporascus cannonballus]|uniref:Uncharacterized protein n=1 Tax=Monosporascus cannonballus TaxID=155416 RepID=A0ABY0GZQ8_9PEZI|nr:hypothetical protein DL762_007288 [Monosporascus cannonballus]RYO86784.1 hypothetical protein DL763_006574 [Monosporascus cannonballus]
MAGSKNFGTYAADSGLYFVGQSGTNLLIDIATTDITMARWGAFVPAVTDHTLDLRARPGDGDGPRRHQVALGGRHAGHSHTGPSSEAPNGALACVSSRTIAPYLPLVSRTALGSLRRAPTSLRGRRRPRSWPRAACVLHLRQRHHSVPRGAAVVATRRYKWICVLSAAVRMVRYGTMLRLRGGENGVAEILAVQLMQVCSGMVGTTLLVPPQIVVGRREMPLCDAHWGVARRPILASGLASSIMGVVPDSGTPERVAVG